eukprot:NODE_11068_length_316_cov_18.764045_g10155_i0.p2 GENE.NODE_11068_length_316_cov_18.764045_g10155_i0~~NODE_11068_length_316_cov_18.764045_g10155_i0.p2  ORF type:complete len:65 (+),score=20.71 NODE_11068_length_316_cov_18.764045_g10155_i0:28-195(+)
MGDREPLRTLSMFRRRASTGEVVFGSYATADSPAVLHLGSRITVVSIRKPIEFAN